LDTAAVTINLEAVNMTITHADGRSVKGFILSRTENTMRVAIENGEDPMVLICIDGTWMSEDSIPVQVEFEWQRHHRKETTISESDCICPKELAARLIHLLLSGDERESGSDASLEQHLAGLEVSQMMESAGHAAFQSLN
jgi:hypothetical protein